jgi:hypothetical protein
MKNRLMSVADAATEIASGAVLVIAGSEEALSKLPKGAWIGGTSVYFMTAEGGRVDRENVFVTRIDHARSTRTARYAGDDLFRFVDGRFDHGFDVILIPAFTPEHQAFALRAAEAPGLFDQPLMGWITGVHLDDIGSVSPKVFDGATGLAHDSGALVLHVAVDAAVAPNLDIVNLFEQDPAADAITFETSGFGASTATVNGRTMDFAEYITQSGVDTRLPLVANYAGAMINVSFQSVDPSEGVKFYAPVLEGVEYRLAKSPGDYATSFASRVKGDGEAEMSCNCILNFLYGEMEGRSTGTFSGPATFGEIAYMLVNQTMVRLKLADAHSLAAE